MPRSAPPDAQLGLFADPAATRLAASHRAAAALAARIPPHVRFGTSSWSFPGWRGLVYAANRSDAQLARDGLREYAQHPLLTTVGIDRGYYAPVPPADLARYATQLPAGFPCCMKAPEALTAPVHLGHGRGARGEANPRFLDVDFFRATVADPVRETFADHAGPILFEFPPMPAADRLAPDVFVGALDDFLGSLPRDLPYAVEIRDRAYLTPAYASVLAAHRVAHVYSYWSRMPMPLEQAAIVPLDTASFGVVRLLMRPGTNHDDRRNAFAPFDRLVDVDLEMRSQVVELLRRLGMLDRRGYVLINNKAEGSAPLTIAAIAQLLVGP